jgi:hypothetical protein
MRFFRWSLSTAMLCTSAGLLVSILNGPKWLSWMLLLAAIVLLLMQMAHENGWFKRGDR